MVDDSPLLGLSQRLQPSNLQAEQALLGALLANNRAYERVADFLEPQHFADPIHGRIYQRIVERILDGYTADAVTLRNDFENTGVLDEVGGTAYLAQLLTAMVGIINAGEYGRAVVDTWLRRQLIGVAETIANNAFGSDPALDATKQREVAERLLADLGGAHRGGTRLVSLGEAFSAALASMNKAYRTGVSPGLMTGLAAVDKALGGLWPGELTIIGGAPGSGKTALVTQMGLGIAERYYRAAIRAGAEPEEAQRQPGVLILSREMSAESLAARVAAQRAGVAVEKLLAGEFDEVTAGVLAAAERDMKFWPLRILDCRKTPLKLLAARTRLHLQRQPELAVALDHLLVANPDDGDRKNNRGHDASSVTAAATGQRDLAGEFGIPFVALSQISRPRPEERSRRPWMQSLKWGGEDVGDQVAFVHRPIMWAESDKPEQGKREGETAYKDRVRKFYDERDSIRDLAELVVSKRRQGRTGVWRMKFHGPTTSFSDWGVASEEEVI